MKMFDVSLEEVIYSREIYWSTINTENTLCEMVKHKMLS